jgi:hypothetical protein
VSKNSILRLLGLALLFALLVYCEGGYTASGFSSNSKQDLNGGKLEVRSKKANGSLTEDIEVNIDGVYTLEADVTLSVEKGTYNIELIGKNDQVTLALEASDGQSVSGHGWMAVDSFGDASYRVTAVEAEGVEYTIEYVFY